MKLYISKHIEYGQTYKKKTIVPIVIGTVLLIVFAALSGVLIAASGGVSTVLNQWLITIGLFVVVIMFAVKMHKNGKNVYRDALVFCVDDSDRLFLVDVRKLAPANHGHWGSSPYLISKFYRGIDQTESLLQQILEENLLEKAMRKGDMQAYGTQIVRVHALQRVLTGTYLVCDILKYSKLTQTVKYDITNHGDDLYELLKERVK